MLNDFSWNMTGYIPKHAVNPSDDGIDVYKRQVGNAVAPSVLVREQVNNFLHGHPSTDDLCLDFIA